MARVSKAQLASAKLTKVSSGDMDNGPIIAYMENNEELKIKTLQQFVANNASNPLIDMLQGIFTYDIDDDTFRKVSIALSFFDAICEITHKDPPTKNPNEIYFALLVNWNATKHSNAYRIKSRQALTAAASKQDGDLDYREYITNNDGEDTKFQGEYKNINVALNDWSSDIILKLPIIKGPLGTFRFCTEKIAAKMVFKSDSENTEHMVSSSLWLSLIEEGISKRRTMRFAPFESGRLAKIVKVDNNVINQILAENDFSRRYSFMNIYDLDYTDQGNIVLKNTTTPPELEENTSGLSWGAFYGKAMVLQCARSFYVASSYNVGAVNVYMQ